MPIYLSGPPANPFSRLLAGLVGVLALVGAVFFGLFMFALAIGLGLVAWAALWLRMWWLRRRMPSTAGRSGEGPGPSSQRAGEDEGKVIDADYEVVSRDQDDREP